MNEIFADTFYFLALLSPSDEASQRVPAALGVSALKSTNVSICEICGYGQNTLVV